MQMVLRAKGACCQRGAGVQELVHGSGSMGPRPNLEFKGFFPPSKAVNSTAEG